MKGTRPRRKHVPSLMTPMCRGVPAAILPRRDPMADPRIVADPRIASPGRRAHPWYRWAVVLYDRAYRVVHGLDRLPAQVGPALCVEVRCSRRARRLPDGTQIASGDRVGVIHLNNARLTAVHVNGQPPLAIGLEFRRWFLASLRELAQLAAAGGPLADVRAFCAITIFHRVLTRLGFHPERDGIVWPGLTAAYQRALMAALHPAGPLRPRRVISAGARRLWMTRAELLSRYT